MKDHLLMDKSMVPAHLLRKTVLSKKVSGHIISSRIGLTLKKKTSMGRRPRKKPRKKPKKKPKKKPRKKPRKKMSREKKMSR